MGWTVSAAPPKPFPVPQEPALPALRQDLEIMRSGTNADGAPAWVVYDPLQHKYFQINHEARELLSIWKKGSTISQWVQAAHDNLDLSVDPTSCTALLDFARASRWIFDDRPGHWHLMAEEVKKSHHSLPMQLVHNYLFFRFPLVQPQAALKAAMPFVAPLYSARAVAITASIGLIGLYFVSRQWSQFIATFHDYFSPEGLVCFSLSLFFVKALHELGHAFTAVRYGCRVPTIGVAFIVMAPLLYTDVTETWRLSNRKHRLLVDAAGILVELGIACLATFLWVFLPEGPARGVAFTMATTSWIMSVLLNMSPFTRFDGYYLLSDYLQVDNLQPRAFALGQWRLRQILFAPDVRPPEVLPPRLTNTLVAYAWIIWLYRFVIFTGIAVLVYHYFFKTLGIILFSVEIWFFVARPIVREIMSWPKIAVAQVSRGRTACTGLMALAAVLAFIVPWSGRIDAPALLADAEIASVFPPRAGMIKDVAVHSGDAVQKGDVLARLASPELDSAIQSSSIEVELYKARMSRTAGDQSDKSQLLILSGQLDSQIAKRDGLQNERDQLTVRAPISGTIATLAPHLQNGQWLAKNELIAVMTGGKQLVVRGYIAESHLSRVKEGMTGRFVPDDLTLRAALVTVHKLSLAGATTIDISELASVYGGRVSVEPDAAQRLAPVEAQYLAEFSLEPTAYSTRQTLRGVVQLNGARESFIFAMWRQVAKVLIRESGF